MNELRKEYGCFHTRISKKKRYDLYGARGRHMDVYDDKVVLSVKPGFGSFITKNALDEEKTI